MKVIMATSIAPTTLFIIFFLTLIYFIEIQFVYSQTIENELVANALDTVEKATTSGNSKITESPNNISESIDITNTTDRSIQHGQSEFKDSTINWINGESDKLSFKYPSHWNVNISDSRFDNYELLFTDQTNNASIQVLDEALSASHKFIYKNNLEGYFDQYIMNNALSYAYDYRKIETYPIGNVSIAGLPTYSELYLSQGYAVLISLAFQEDNDRHYTVFSSSPASNYDQLEPTMLEIIKSITPKNIQKLSDQEDKNSSNSPILNNNQSMEQFREECLKNFNENICNNLFR